MRRALGLIAQNRRGVAQEIATFTDLKVQQAGTPNMTVDVLSGRCAISGTVGSYQGVYLCENRGTTNLAISAADATNPRLDLVVAKVQDSSYSGGTNAWSLAVVTGTPAASPSLPTAPANSISLASISVPALDTAIGDAQITDLRTRATSMGGINICTSTTRQPV